MLDAGETLYLRICRETPGRRGRLEATFYPGIGIKKPRLIRVRGGGRSAGREAAPQRRGAGVLHIYGVDRAASLPEAG